MEKKKILVYGLGISGISAIKTLTELGESVTVIDSKNKDELMKIAAVNNLININFLDTNDIFDIGEFDLIIKSPSIRNDDSIIVNALCNNVEVINDIEYSFRMGKKLFTVGITGTNGKTTTTTIIGEIFKKWKGKSIVTGNIGSGIMWDYFNAHDDDYVAIELSSYHLENIIDFRTNISIITNISPDHLTWHKNYENYKNAKFNIFKNQIGEDICILNYDDEVSLKAFDMIKCKKYLFSKSFNGIKGIYVNDNKIIINIDKPIYICNVDEIFIPGAHNLENCLAAALATYLAGVDIPTIVHVLKNFRGVEHRLEYVKQINGIKFYNDSKGTNTDATIKAIESFKMPIHIILGGYDKGEDFGNLICKLENRVVSASVLGETSKLIVDEMDKYNFKNYKLVNNLEEAILDCYEKSKEGDIVLLSPACASFDMFENYTIRGKEFKRIVDKLGESDEQ